MRRTIVFLAPGMMFLMLAFVACDSKSAIEATAAEKLQEQENLLPPPPAPPAQTMAGKSAIAPFANATEISSSKVKVTYVAPPPPYPAMAKRAKIQGKVIVQITLGTDGIPLSVKPVSGHAVLHDYAVNWAKKWKFKADLKDGQTVTFKHTLDCKLP